MRTLVIYHRNCADGFGAAWAASQSLGGESRVELFPAYYGESAPDVTGRDVFIVDFSYPRDTLLAMRAVANRFFVIDHHKTARADLSDLLFAEFDMNRSGAVMTWERLLPHDPVPLLLRYVQDRDLWRWQLPHSKEVSAWIRCREQTLTEWDRMAVELEHRGEESFARCVDFGKGALADVESYVRSMVECARPVTFLGHRILAVNAPGPNISELVGALAEKADAGFALGYSQRADGKWSYSLRARRGEVDVSVIAKAFGGGGHAKAAGFESDRTLDQILEVSPWPLSTLAPMPST